MMVFTACGLSATSFTNAALTTTSTCFPLNPLGNFISGVVTFSKQTYMCRIHHIQNAHDHHDDVLPSNRFCTKHSE